MVKKTTPPPGRRSVGPPDQAIGQRIRARRVEIKLSQTDLGAMLGVSFQQVQKYEKGRNRVGASRLQQIATALNVPVTFFYGADASKAQVEVDSLIFSDTRFSLRLLRAYARIRDDSTRRQLVGLMERIAETTEAT